MHSTLFVFSYATVTFCLQIVADESASFVSAVLSRGICKMWHSSVNGQIACRC